MSAMSNSVSDIPARWDVRGSSASDVVMAIQPAVLTIVSLRSSTFSDSCKTLEYVVSSLGMRQVSHTHILHRLKDFFILARHFDNGATFFPTAPQPWRRTGRRYPGDDRVSPEGNDSS